MSRLRVVAARLWLVPAAVAGWELASRHAGNPFFPPPSAIADGVYRRWFSGPPSHLWMTPDATANLLPSLGRLLTAWAVAGAVGAAVGIAVGRSPLLSGFVEPLIHFGRAIPPPALVPVFLVLFRIGTPMQLATIMFGVIWPVLLNAIDGARYVDRLHVDTASVFGLSRTQRLVRIVLPAAGPKIFAGLRLSLSLSLIIMVISEFVGSTNGIGRELEVTTQSGFDVQGMWAIVALLGILGLVLNASFAAIERRVLAWQRGSTVTA